MGIPPVPVNKKKSRKSWKEICRTLLNFNPDQCPHCKTGTMVLIERMSPQRGPPFQFLLKAKSQWISLYSSITWNCPHIAITRKYVCFLCSSYPRNNHYRLFLLQNFKERILFSSSVYSPSDLIPIIPFSRPPGISCNTASCWVLKCAPHEALFIGNCPFYFVSISIIFLLCSSISL